MWFVRFDELRAPPSRPTPRWPGEKLSVSHTFGPPRQLAHGSLLPQSTRRLISPSDRLILSFVLEYIEEREQTGVRASRVPCDSALRSVCA